MDSLLLDLAPSPEDPCRGEGIWAVVACYRESKSEMEHCFSCLTQPKGLSMRIMVFVDGAQNTALFASNPAVDGDGGLLTEASMSAARQAAEQGLPPPDPWRDDSLRCLVDLVGILRLGVPVPAHGCLRFTGESPQGVPFEVYVKGPSVLRTKRASHAMSFSLLACDGDAGRPLPRALLLVDGDTGPEAGTIGKMFSCLVSQGLGGVTPMLLPNCAHTPALLWQTARNWGVSGASWASQSLFGFQHPACGAIVMFSREAVTSCMQEYCRASCPTSLWDSMQIDMGEDSYFTNLVLGNGFKVQHLLHCHATSFMPETWLEYLCQQCRWKRSHLGNRSDLLFKQWRSWLGAQATLWPFEVLECLFRGEFLGIGFAVFMVASISGAPLRDYFLSEDQPSDSDLGIDPKLWIWALSWAFLVPYILLAAGRPIAEMPTVHLCAICFAMVLPLAQLALTMAYWQAYVHWEFWLLLIVPALLNSLSKLPHGIRKPWAGLVLPFAAMLVVGVENVLAPINGVANADASATLGWGTRQGAGERAALAKLEDHDQVRDLRRRARNRLLVVWVFANMMFGFLPLLLGMEGIMLRCAFALTAAHLMTNQVLALIYSLRLYLIVRQSSVPKESGSGHTDAGVDDPVEEGKLSLLTVL